MGASLDLEDDDVISDINVTPFVDIILVVLIIFMMTSTTMQRGSFKVDLPQAAAAGESVSSTVNIVLASDGRVAMNGQTVHRDDLGRLIKSETRADPDLRAVVAADKTVDYGDVIRIIDLVKENGVRSFALNIDRS